MSFRVKVRRNDFAKIAATLPAKAGAVVTATSTQVVMGAQTRSRVGATGKLKRGWASRPAGLFKRLIVNSTYYWHFHERGTHKMPAKPMVTPAVEQARPGFLAALGRIFQVR